MRNPQSPNIIARRNLNIFAATSLALAIASFMISLWQWLIGGFPTPDKVKLEMLHALNDALATAVFLVLPLFGCVFLVLAVGIWVELRRLRKGESAPSELEIVNRKS